MLKHSCGGLLAGKKVYEELSQRLWRQFPHSREICVERGLEAVLEVRAMIVGPGNHWRYCGLDVCHVEGVVLQLTSSLLSLAATEAFLMCRTTQAKRIVDNLFGTIVCWLWSGALHTSLLSNWDFGSIEYCSTQFYT